MEKYNYEIEDQAAAIGGLDLVAAGICTKEELENNAKFSGFGIFIPMDHPDNINPETGKPFIEFIDDPNRIKIVDRFGKPL